MPLVLERIHPEDVARVQEAFTTLTQNGSNVDLEHRLLMPDGSVKTVRVLAHAARQASWSALVGAVTDITAMKNTFEEIGVLRDQLYKENLALREEIDVAKMFEEIVGSLLRFKRCCPTWRQ